MQSSSRYALALRHPRARLVLLSLALAGAGACELAEVTTAPARDLLVVEAVLRAGSARQVILLHRSIDGRSVRGDPGARVSVRGPDGREQLFRFVPQTGVCADGVGGPPTVATDSLDVQPSCFVAQRPASTLDVAPGATYELLVEGSGGEVVRGRTTVPGDFAFRTPAPQTSSGCMLAPNTLLPAEWTLSRGAWSYITSMQVDRLREAFAPLGVGAPSRLELTGVSISEADTTLTIPADIGLFELGDVKPEILTYLQKGFPPGVTALVAVAAVDRNFVNAVRGGAFNPSGNVRISSVVGDGVGVFGSMVPRSMLLHVGTDLPFPPCLGA